jgi:hypothetical protein
MLRLKPSELTLTPGDVDETFRRMARKQANQSSRHAATPQSALSARPVLRRGPQRAVRDAITALGDIPILRPEPHQVVHSSVEEEMDDAEFLPTGPRERIDSVSDSMAPNHFARTSPANPSAISPLQSLHLPFRLRRGHGDAPTSPVRVQYRDEETHISPQRGRDRIAQVPMSSVARYDSPEESGPTRLTTTPSPAGLRGGGSSRRHDVHAWDPSSSPSSSHRKPLQDFSHDQEARQQSPIFKSTSNEASQTLYLEGYFRDPGKHPRGPDYWFRELVPEAPRTEPRRSSGRQTLPTRSLSFSSALTQLLPTQGHASSGSHSNIVLGSDASPNYPPEAWNSLLGNLSQQEDSSAAAPRQFSSEASAASGAFSLYELPPESRRVSNEQFAHGQQFYPQYDGAVASLQTNRGAYHSVHSSQLHSCSSSSNQPPANSGASGQHGVSPLPSMPYTRNPNPHSNTQKPQMAYSSTSPSGEHLDAATAAVQDLPSPLDPYSEHYENILHGSRHTMPAQPSPYQSPYQSTYQDPSRLPNNGPQQFDSRVRRNTPDVQAQNVNDIPPHLPTLPFLHPAIPPVNPPSHAPQAVRRNAQGTRANQRSSENMPVRPPVQRRGPSLNSQIQIHRANFEQFHHAMQQGSNEVLDTSRQWPSRHSLPQPTISRDTSNRHRAQARHPAAAIRDQARRRTSHLSSSPLPHLDHASSAQPGPSIRRDAIRAPRITSRFRSTDTSTRPARDGVRNVTPAIFPATHLHTTRNLPSTALVLDHASAMPSLRSPLVRETIPVRPPPRRVPPQQRDQENSGAGEEQLMREEEAAIQARHGEEQRETMDETPPRVGRVERRMLQ